MVCHLEEGEVHGGGIEEDGRHIEQHRHLTRVRAIALHHALDQKLGLVFLATAAARAAQVLPGEGSG